jgi:2-oxo-4-hydroxy-4-carboxy-5-ureidoimidazoline decarboxylase
MLNLRELNALSREDFAHVIGTVFEHSPWIAEQTWPRRPFENRDYLHAALCQTVADANEQAKLDLIRAHPDLVGRAVLTKESQTEQAGANLDHLSREEIDRFSNYNRQYRDKFGFPFVICARLNKKDAILEAFPRRLQNSPAQEKETALEEIYKIAELRLRDLIS